MYPTTSSMLFGSISITSDRFPFVRCAFHYLFGLISFVRSSDRFPICSDSFQFVRTDFHMFGPISICSVRFHSFCSFRFPFVDFHPTTHSTLDDDHDHGLFRFRPRPAATAGASSVVCSQFHQRLLSSIKSSF